MTIKSKRENRKKLHRIIFYICYALFLISSMVRYVIPLKELANIMSVAELILLSIAFILNIMHLPKKRVFLIISITILVIISRFISDTSTFLLLWLLIIAGKDMKFDNIVKYDLAIKLPLLIIVPLLYFSGLTEVNLHYRDGVLRHSMGFSNPNIFSIYVMSALMDLIFLRRKNIGLGEILLSIVSILLIDYFADSRTQIFSIIALLAIILIKKISKKVKQAKKERRFPALLVNNSFSILMIVSLLYSLLLMHNLIDRNIANEINTMTSNRSRAAVEMIEKYGIKPFGQQVELVSSMVAKKTGKKGQNLDNVYVYIVLAYGVIPAMILCLFFNKYMKSVDKNNDIIKYIMLIYIFGGLMEHFVIEPQFNVFLLYFSYILFNKIDTNKKQIGSLNVTH